MQRDMIIFLISKMNMFILLLFEEERRHKHALFMTYGILLPFIDYIIFFHSSILVIFQSHNEFILFYQIDVFLLSFLYSLCVVMKLKKRKEKKSFFIVSFLIHNNNKTPFLPDLNPASSSLFARSHEYNRKAMNNFNQYGIIYFFLLDVSRYWIYFISSATAFFSLLYIFFLLFDFYRSQLNEIN